MDEVTGGADLGRALGIGSRAGIDAGRANLIRSPLPATWLSALTALSGPGRSFSILRHVSDSMCGSCHHSNTGTGRLATGPAPHCGADRAGHFGSGQAGRLASRRDLAGGGASRTVRLTDAGRACAGRVDFGRIAVTPSSSASPG